MNSLLEKYIVVCFLLFSAAAMLFPQPFTDLKPAIPFLLAVIMFGIGFNIKKRNLSSAWLHRKTLSWLLACKYLLMPIITFIVARLFHFTFLETVGMVIIGASPGGTSANVMSYLSRSNVMVTVTLTFLTTLLSPILIPLIIFLFFHKDIQIPFLSIFFNLLLIIVLPIITGICLNKFLDEKLLALKKMLPSLSILAIAAVIACVVALSRDKILSTPYQVLAGITIFNLLCYAFAGIFLYFQPATLPQDVKGSIIFEFSLFDTGLSVVVATAYFGPAAALPAAMLSFIQNITASFLVRLLHKKYRNAI